VELLLVELLPGPQVGGGGGGGHASSVELVPDSQVGVRTGP
jgi:hypothetical protein